MHIQRVITAVILLMIVALLLFAVPQGVFAAFCVLLCLMGTHELFKMYHVNLCNQIISMAIMAFSCSWLYFIHIDISLVLVTLIMSTWCFLAPFILITQPKHFHQVLIICFALLIFIPAFYALVELYSLFGPWRLISILAVAWIADVGAYYVGMRFGKHKLAYNISPGKTLEGALGGLIAVSIYLTILKLSNQTLYLTSWATVIKFSIILSSVGMLGDLLESWFKRVAKVKDSGNLLPGHGGVFDRIDSLVAVVSVAYALICVNY